MNKFDKYSFRTALSHRKLDISVQNRILTIFNLNKSDWREQQTSAAFLDVSNTASITTVEFS